MAVVKVGAATEVELKEKKHRIEDALSAPLGPPSKRVWSPVAAPPWSGPARSVENVIKKLNDDEKIGA